MTPARSFPFAAWRCLSSLEASRPPALRQYDQIPMRGADLLAQAFDLAPQLVGRSVLFLGDYDGMAPLLLLLEDAGLLIAPKYLTVLDFDHRVLAYHQKLVSVTPQVQRLRVRPYNVLHPVPPEWRGDFEVFYTNPPYGASNRGASVLAFLCRGLDLVGPAGEGYLVYPEFSARAWAANALHHLNTALGLAGWTLAQDSIPPRRYHLDDDPDLASVTHHLIAADGRGRPLPWTHRTLTDIDLPYFYGRSTLAPYPSEILCPTFNATPQPNHVHNFNALHLDFSS